MSTTITTVPTVSVYPPQHHQRPSSTSHLPGGTHQSQGQSKIVVLWSSEDGRTQTSVRQEQQQTGGCSGGGGGGGGNGVAGGTTTGGNGRIVGDAWKPLPFQYQIPINKYSTLHSVAVKRSSFKRHQSDLANHRATIAIPRTLLDATSDPDRPHSSYSPAEDCQKSQAGNDDEVDLGSDVIKPSVTFMASQSSGGCGNGQAITSAPIDASVVGDHHRQQNQQHPHPHPVRTAMQASSTASADELRKKVEMLDEKNALTDIVIRQLSEQIARLQSNSPVTAAATAAVAMATKSGPTAASTSAPPSSNNHSDAEITRCPSNDDQSAIGKDSKKTKDAIVQVDLGWPEGTSEHSKLQTNEQKSFDEELFTDDVGDSPDSLHDRLLACRLREATMMGHLKDYRRRIDELHFVREMHEAQIQRMNEEMARLKEVLVECRGRDKETQSLVADLRLSLADLQQKFQELTMLTQLKDIEHRETTVELQRKISQIENEKHRLIGALQSTGAAGYYAIAHCTANTERRLQQQRLQHRRDQHHARIHGNSNNNSFDYNDFDDDDDDEDDHYFDNTTEYSTAPKINHDYKSEEYDLVDGDIQTGPDALSGRSAVVTSVSLGDVKTSASLASSSAANSLSPKTGTLKPLSTSPPSQRILRRIDSAGSGRESPTPLRRNADARPVPHRDDTVANYPSNGERSQAEVGTGNSRQRVSFYVTAAETPLASTKSTSFADSIHQTQAAQSTTGPLSDSLPSFSRLRAVASASASSPGSQHRMRPPSGGAFGEPERVLPTGNTHVVQATIESRHVSPGRKWEQSMQSTREHLNDVGRPATMAGSTSGVFPIQTSATLPRRTKAGAPVGDRLDHPVNGGGRSFEALVSSGDRADLARAVFAGNDVTAAKKTTSSGNFNHARLVEGELVIFNGVD